MARQAAIERAALQEVIDLHRFFEEWLAGRCECSDAYFDEHLSSRVAPDFSIVMPGASLLVGDALLQELRQAYGSNPQFRIQVRYIAARRLGDDGLILVTYEEWQKHARNSKPPNNGRISSAVLQQHSAATHGFRWLHVHETWLPEATIAADTFDF